MRCVIFRTCETIEAISSASGRCRPFNRGKPLLELGTRGVQSDTGCEGPPYLAQRAAGPFNHPTEMMPHPNGDIYVTDGYRNARVHRVSRSLTWTPRVRQPEPLVKV